MGDRLVHRDCLAAIVVIGISGYRRHGRGFETDEHHLDTADDRRRFLGFAALLLAGLGGIATIYAAESVAFIPGCYLTPAAFGLMPDA